MNRPTESERMANVQAFWKGSCLDPAPRTPRAPGALLPQLPQPGEWLRVLRAFTPADDGALPLLAGDMLHVLDVLHPYVVCVVQRGSGARPGCGGVVAFLLHPRTHPDYVWSWCTPAPAPVGGVVW